MSTVALSIRVLAAVAAGARLAHRPRGVVHIVSGPLTPSGRFAAAGARTACHQRTRRLSVVERHGGAFDLHGRRLCRRCTATLPPVLGREVGRLVSRDDYAAAFGHMTVDDLRQAALWTRNLDEVHQVGYLASVVLGPGHTRPVDEVLTAARARIVAATRTAEELEETRAAREAEAFERARIAAARKEAARLDRAHDRARRGQYLTPWERQLLHTA